MRIAASLVQAFVISVVVACASSKPRGFELPVGTSLYEPDPEEPAGPRTPPAPAASTSTGPMALPAPLRPAPGDESGVGADAGGVADELDPESEGTGLGNESTEEPMGVDDEPVLPVE